MPCLTLLAACCLLSDLTLTRVRMRLRIRASKAGERRVCKRLWRSGKEGRQQEVSEAPLAPRARACVFVYAASRGCAQTGNRHGTAARGRDNTQRRKDSERANRERNETKKKAKKRGGKASKHNQLSSLPSPRQRKRPVGTPTTVMQSGSALSH